MKLQARFLLLYLFLFGAVSALLLLQGTFELNRSRFVLQSELEQHQGFYEKITAVEGKPLETLSIDYSFWDEMVGFIKKRNLAFAIDNIDTGLETYDADAAWVYRPDASLVYFKAADGSTSLQNLGLPASFFTRLSTNRFEHFFLQHADGLLELRAATVHPGDDPDHKTTPQGFWIVGRFWDESLVSNLSDLTQSQLKLAPATTKPASALGTDTVSFSEALKSWDSQIIATVTSTASVPVVKDLRNLYYRQLLLLLFFTIVSVLTIVISIWRLVLRPMKLITQSIKNQQPENLDQMSGDRSEFGSLAQTVQQFYRQKITIQETQFLKGKLLELSRAKSEFLAIAAHELKGPVGNIHLFAANLADLLGTKANKQVLNTEVERIDQQARKATRLINDMYEASKGGQYLELNRTEFDFDDFIRSEIDNAHYSTPQQIVLKGATHHRITSDTDRLGQVMANLIRNASKYSGPTSTITIHLWYDNNQVTVEVQDAGIGISPEDQAKIFSRFFRSTQVANTYPGLGLGLSVCHEIITALGGKIWVRSQLDQGSQFYFSLPVSSSEREIS